MRTCRTGAHFLINADLLFCSQDVHENILCEVLKRLGTEVLSDDSVI